MKKNLSETTSTKLYRAKKWGTNIRQQCIKNKRLSDYIYSTAILECKICVMSIKTGQFIKLCKIIKNDVKANRIICFFVFTGNKGVFGTQSNIHGGFFLTAKSR